MEKKEGEFYQKNRGICTDIEGGGARARWSTFGREKRSPSGGGYPQIHKVHPRVVDKSRFVRLEKGHRERKYPHLHSKLSTIVDNYLSFFHKIRDGERGKVFLVLGTRALKICKKQV